MTKLPIIAIPCHYSRSSNYIKTPINGQYNTYIDAVVAAGGTPFLVPLQVDDTQLRALYELADGLLLTGGGDIDPATYHEIPDDTVSSVQPDRDRVEITLARWAIVEQKPVLGICGGLQLMNVHFGGTLYQDILSQNDGAKDHEQKSDPRKTRHTVNVENGSRLSKIVRRKSFRVNTTHHQAVKKPGRGLNVSAFSPDGIVEALEAVDDRFVLGVQWHPEFLVRMEPHFRIFKLFIKTSTPLTAG